MTTIAASNGFHEVAHTNGKFIESIDPEDPQYRRELQRPADVKEDMRQMESRQRVSSILNSQAFREELESIIADQLKHGPHPASIIALQQISELLLPSSSRWYQVSSMGRVGSNTVIPINDVRGVDSLNYGKGERLVRCKLASLFRLIELFGWSNGVNQCISFRLSQDLDTYLINPFGLLSHEVTASSLSKIDINGNIIEHGSTTYNINKSLFKLKSAIYKARPDIKCILHVQTPSTTAVSSLKCGFLQISQEAILCGNVSYHDYKGSFGYDTDEEVKRLLADDIGPCNKIMFIRNFGVLICGETIEETWFYLCNCIQACESQLRIMTAGLDNLILPNDELKKRLIDNYNQQLNEISLNENKKWKIGELEFEACMRCLDNAAYRTGYVYRQPIMRSIDRNAIKEIEIPPTCSSTSYDDDYIKKLKEFRGASSSKNGDWLNTPNAYTKHEESEYGPFQKKVTKWLPESSPNKMSTPIRIDNKNQFAPLSIDPKELKNHQKQIKQDRFQDKITPGHQSKILENIVDDKLDAANTSTSSSQRKASSQTAINTSSNLNGYFSKVKKKYYDDKIDAGPKSRHLDFITEEESASRERSKDESKEKDGGSGTLIPNGVQELINLSASSNSPSKNATYVYGAASKGIIRRDQQNNSIVYKSFQSSPNPFQQMDKQDIEKYKKEIEQSQLREQVQRKEDMHKELLDKSTPILTAKQINNEQQQYQVNNNDSTKKSTKSHTIPRSKSLLDKKNDNKEASSSEQSRDNSPKKTNSSLTAVDAPKQTSPSQQPINKSATLSTSTATKEQQQTKDKPKKKSKLRSFSFLKSKKSSKNNDQTQ